MSKVPHSRDIIREAVRWGFIEHMGKKHRMYKHPALPGTLITFSHGAHGEKAGKHTQAKVLRNAITQLQEKGYRP